MMDTDDNSTAGTQGTVCEDNDMDSIEKKVPKKRLWWFGRLLPWFRRSTPKYPTTYLSRSAIILQKATSTDHKKFRDDDHWFLTVPIATPERNPRRSSLLPIKE